MSILKLPPMSLTLPILWWKVEMLVRSKIPNDRHLDEAAKSRIYEEEKAERRAEETERFDLIVVSAYAIFARFSLVVS